MNSRLSWPARIALLGALPAVVTLIGMTWFVFGQSADHARTRLREATLLDVSLGSLSLRGRKGAELAQTVDEMATRLDAHLILLDGAGAFEAGSKSARSVVDLKALSSSQEVAGARRLDAALRDAHSPGKHGWTYAAAKVPGSDYVLWMGRDDSGRVAAMGAPVVFTWILVLLTCFAVLLLAKNLARSVTAPVSALQRVVDSVTEGDFSRRVPSSEDKQFDRLGTAFNEMTAQLETTLRAAREEAAQLTTVLEGLSEGVIALDEHEHVTFVNGAARDLLALPADPEIKGSPFYEYVREPRILGLAQAVVTTRESQQAEVHQEGPPRRTIQIYAAPAFAGSTSLIMVFRDMSRLRRLESMRSDFVSNVSHELRTPLAAIAAAVETLSDDEARLDNEVGPRFLSMIDRNAARLEALLQDILALSRMESRPESLAREPVEFGGIARSVVEDLRGRARRAGIELVPPGADRLPLLGDGPMLYRVVENLIVNAITYTPEGGRVEVKTEVEANAAVLRVCDTGVGIPHASLGRIFERFYRVDKARSRGAGGTGLGLAIVKHVTGLHGGSVEVVSEVGQGSTFTVRIPLADRVSQESS